MIRKSVIVSGGFGDIGKAVAEKFAKNGFNVALTYHNMIDVEFLEKIKSFGVNAIAIKCDQTVETDIINFVSSAIKEFEFVDCFVACAGLAESPEFLTQKETAEIDKLISVNLRGTILFNREILKYFMKNKHGNIINISSIYGISGGSLESVYSACKAGIIGLTKSLAVECAPYVRVNAIAPGAVDTKMILNLNEDDKEYVINQTPLGRLGTPEDIANLTYFLASDESNYVTGEVIKISGGVERY